MKTFQWTAEEGEAPRDAVMVSVRLAGSKGRRHRFAEAAVLAKVEWPMIIEDEDMLIARSEGPFDVDVALDYAEEIAHLYGLQRVVVQIKDQTLWQGHWGRLADRSGFD